MAKDAKRIGELLQAILPEGTENIGSILQMGRSWRALVGDELAGYSRIHVIDNHVLTVDISHPGFMQIMQMKQHKILNKIQREYPDLEVRRIRIRLVEDLKSAPDPFKVPHNDEKSESPENSAPKNQEQSQNPDSQKSKESSGELTLGEKFRQEMEKLLD